MDNRAIEEQLVRNKVTLERTREGMKWVRRQRRVREKRRAEILADLRRMGVLRD